MHGSGSAMGSFVAETPSDVHPSALDSPPPGSQGTQAHATVTAVVTTAEPATAVPAEEAPGAGLASTAGASTPAMSAGAAAGGAGGAAVALANQLLPDGQEPEAPRRCEQQQHCI